MNGTLSWMMASALAIVMIATGCNSGSDATQHSVPAVRRCLHHHGLTATVVPEPSEPGDWNLLDIRGTIIANLGTAMVTIDVSGSGGNIAKYDPSGTAAPRKLVEAVWDCAGYSAATTPYSCSDDGCVSSY